MCAQQLNRGAKRFPVQGLQRFGKKIDLGCNQPLEDVPGFE